MAGMTAEVASTDPRTGQVVETVAHEFTPAEVDARCRTAAAAAAALDAAGPAGRARLLRAMADQPQADPGAVVAPADRQAAPGRPPPPRGPAPSRLQPQPC